MSDEFVTRLCERLSAICAEQQAILAAHEAWCDRIISVTPKTGRSLDEVDAESARRSREIDAGIARMNAQTITSQAIFLDRLNKARDVICGQADHSKRAEK